MMNKLPNLEELRVQNYRPLLPVVTYLRIFTSRCFSCNVRGVPHSRVSVHVNPCNSMPCPVSCRLASPAAGKKRNFAVII